MPEPAIALLCKVCFSTLSLSTAHSIARTNVIHPLLTSLFRTMAGLPTTVPLSQLKLVAQSALESSSEQSKGSFQPLELELVLTHAWSHFTNALAQQQKSVPLMSPMDVIQKVIAELRSRPIPNSRTVLNTPNVSGNAMAKSWTPLLDWGENALLQVGCASCPELDTLATRALASGRNRTSTPQRRFATKEKFREEALCLQDALKTTLRKHRQFRCALVAELSRSEVKTVPTPRPNTHSHEASCSRKASCLAMITRNPGRGIQKKWAVQSRVDIPREDHESSSRKFQEIVALRHAKALGSHFPAYGDHRSAQAACKQLRRQCRKLVLSMEQEQHLSRRSFCQNMAEFGAKHGWLADVVVPLGAEQSVLSLAEFREWSLPRRVV